jgi:hypothetical protein
MMDAAWLDDTPYVTEIVTMSDGEPSIKVHSDGESLRRMWTEIERLRHLLFRVSLAVTDPDRDHVDRCVDVLTVVGSTEEWTP